MILLLTAIRLVRHGGSFVVQDLYFFYIAAYGKSLSTCYVNHLERFSTSLPQFNRAKAEHETNRVLTARFVLSTSLFSPASIEKYYLLFKQMVYQKPSDISLGFWAHYFLEENCVKYKVKKSGGLLQEVASYFALAK